MCSPIFVNKTFLALLLLLSYFLGMDLLFYFRAQNYDIRPRSNDTTHGALYYRSPILCELDPICTVTVKAIMLDHPNHFILSPLASLMDRLLGISHRWTWLTPNAISVSHVLVAVIGARYIAQSSLARRQFGVILFQVRAWLDDLDGHVARQRRNIEGERSDVGSVGYLVDGICDGLGCIALVVAVFFLLKRNSNLRGGYYEQLYSSRKSVSVSLSSSSLSSLSSPSPSRHNNGRSAKTSLRNLSLHHMLLVSVYFVLTSAAWNRYIFVYQSLLETDDRPPPIMKEQFHSRQITVLRSPVFWVIALGWKIFNFHAVMDYVLLAIFLNRVWEYVRLVQWQAYAVLLLLVLISEIHYLYTYIYIQSISSV